MTPRPRSVAMLVLGLVLSAARPDLPGPIAHPPAHAAEAGQGLVGRRVRIQAPALGGQWRAGMFNRTRTEPPCFLVLLFKPRESALAAIELAATVRISEVTRLAVFTGPPQAMADWAGLTGPAATGDAWREVDLSAIRASEDGARC